MKNVYIQVIDTSNGISQSGKIEEPVKDGSEIKNALMHFGVEYGHVKWLFNYAGSYYNLMTGEVEGTTKVVHVTVLLNSK